MHGLLWLYFNDLVCEILTTLQHRCQAREVDPGEAEFYGWISEHNQHTWINNRMRMDIEQAAAHEQVGV